MVFWLVSLQYQMPYSVRQQFIENVLNDNPSFLQNARPELEKFYLGDVDLIDMFISGLDRPAKYIENK